MASVLQKVIQGGAKVIEKAAPIAGGIVGGIFGGPAGAAVGAAAGKGLSKGVEKVASNTHLGGHGSLGQGSFTPSSAGSIDEARGQDRSRMKKQYGIEY